MSLFTDSQSDIQTVEITSVDKETAEMEYRSKMIAEVVSRTYPRYPWMVQWHSGGDVSVKLMLSPDTNWGYIIDTDQCSNYKKLTEVAVRAGGELLERLNMPRGTWNGDMPKQNYEGIEVKDRAPIFDGGSSEGFSL